MPPRAATENHASPLRIASEAELPALRRALLAWYRRHKRDLDWRRTRDAYRIWISEVMLQQTRVAAVTEYYRRWVARFPTVRDLARAPIEAVLREWAGLGYYSRARNLHRAARAIAAHRAGEFPRRLDEALALPGVGRYTAAAVLSIAYDAPLAVVDGNVARVIARLAALRGDVRAAPAWQRIAATSAALLAARAPGDWNQAMMELGATLCTPRSPRCGECPIARWCRARALGLAERIPAARRKRAPVRLSLAAAVLLDARGRTLLLKQQGEHSVIFSRLWQFPALAVRERANGIPRGAPQRSEQRRARQSGSAHPDARRALAQHLERAFGLTDAALKPLALARHAVTFRDIRLLPFLVRVEQLPAVAGARTPRLAELARLPILSATRKIARAASAAL